MADEVQNVLLACEPRVISNQTEIQAVRHSARVGSREALKEISCLVKTRVEKTVVE